MTTKKIEAEAFNPATAALNAAQEFAKTFQNGFPGTDAVEKATKDFQKKIEQVAAMGNATAEAVASSSQILAKGLEGLRDELMAFSKVRLDATASLTKSLLGAKTVQDIVELQQKFVKDTYEATVAQASKFSNLGLKLANDAAAPIQSRVTSNVETLLKAA
jgi:phasin family protein